MALPTTTVFRGISWPIQPSATSFPQVLSDDDLIRGDLVQLVMTQKGERPMRPDYGTNVVSLIFEGDEALVDELMRQDLRDAIGKYEPRVALQDIQINRQEGIVTVTLFYVVVATGNPGTVNLGLSLPTAA